MEAWKGSGPPLCDAPALADSMLSPGGVHSGLLAAVVWRGLEALQACIPLATEEVQEERSARLRATALGHQPTEAVSWLAAGSSVVQRISVV